MQYSNWYYPREKSDVRVRLIFETQVHNKKIIPKPRDMDTLNINKLNLSFWAKFTLLWIVNFHNKLEDKGEGSCLALIEEY